MGLDSVELVLEAEERFKIKLDEAACARVRTVADFAALIISSLPRGSDVCQSARRFYRLRSLTSNITGTDTRSIRPRTQLAAIFPRADRRRLWKRLKSEVGYVPALTLTRRADRFFLLVAAFFVFLIPAGVGTTAAIAGVPAALATAALLVLVGATSIVFLTNHHAVVFPDGITTFGDLTRASTPPELPTERGERLVTEHRVLQETREIIAEQLAVGIDTVRPESRLVEDLGLD